MSSCTVLMISGSLRAHSTNSALLRTARMVAPPPIVATLYEGMGSLPHFNPDDDTDPLPPSVADLRRRLDSADAVLFSTPEYAGALPGSFKNLLDWTVGGGTYGKPVAWINASASPTGAADAHESLRKVLQRTGTTIIDAACAHIPVPRAALDSSGLLSDQAVRRQLVAALRALMRGVDESRHPATADSFA